ncbi:MAG: adenylate cyclase [bacterium]|jgi:adenylate cyclase
MKKNKNGMKKRSFIRKIVTKFTKITSEKLKLLQNFTKTEAIKPLQILSISDNLQNQVFIQSLFDEINNIDFQPASSLDFYQSLKKNHYRLIILDCNILRNSLGVLNIIRSLQENEDYIIVAVAFQKVVESDVEKLYHAGISDYILKPYTVQSLVLKFTKICEKINENNYLVQQNQSLLKKIVESRYLGAKLHYQNQSLELKLHKRNLELEKQNRKILFQIAEKIEVEESLREAEKKYRTIFENTIEGIFQTTIDGSYIQANQSLAQIYGYQDTKDMMGFVCDIEHQIYVNQTRRIEFKAILETQDHVIDFESQIYRKDGVVIWIKENARAVRDESREVLYYEGTVEDITARKEAEEQLILANQASDRFVPYRLLKLLGKENIAELSLNDCAQGQMSILFADIRAFTTMSENMSPKEAFQFLNSYLGQVGPIIHENHGFIDKYLGDGIIAVFNKADDAVMAGAEMLRQVRRYNRNRKKAGFSPIAIGIGVNTGDVILGTIGDNERMEGTVIGDAVNSASRIEELTKQYSIPFLIGESTLQQLSVQNKKFTRFVDKAELKGKKKKVQLYEFFLGDTPKIQNEKESIQKMFMIAWKEFDQKNYKKASELFQECLGKADHDPLVQFFYQRSIEKCTFF